MLLGETSPWFALTLPWAGQSSAAQRGLPIPIPFPPERDPQVRGSCGTGGGMPTEEPGGEGEKFGKEVLSLHPGEDGM